MTQPMLVLVFVGLLVAPADGRADDSQNLVSRATEAHTASLAAITTLRAKVTAEVSMVEGAALPPGFDPKKAAEIKRYVGEFSRAGVRLRMTETEGPLGRRSVLKDLAAKKAYLLGDSTPSGRPTGGLVTDDFQLSSPIDLCDGWVFCLPRPVPPDYETYVPLKEAVAKARKVTAWAEKLDGADSIRLDLEMDAEGSKFEIWLDIGTNYLFKRIVSTPRGKPGLEFRMSEFKEIKKGIFCPTKAERILYRGTKTRIELTDIRVNDPIPDSVFDVRLAPGGLFTDESDGKVYKAGSDGKPGSVVGRVVLPAGEATSPAPTLAATPLNADDPVWWSWPRVLAIASVIVGLGAVVCVVDPIFWARNRREYCEGLAV